MIPKDETDENFNVSPNTNQISPNVGVKNKSKILKDFYGEPDDDFYTNPHSPSNIRVEDLQSLSARLRQKKADKEITAQVRRELRERNERILERDRQHQKQLEEANKEVEINLQRRMIENERKLLIAIEEHERKAREFTESQKVKCAETKNRFEEMRQRSQALERFRAIHELFKRIIEKFVTVYSKFDRDIQAMFGNYKSAVNQIIKQFESKFQSIDKSALGQDEINEAQRLYKDVEKVIMDMGNKVAEIKEAQLAAKQAEEQKLKEEQENQAALDQQKQNEAEAAAALASLSRQTENQPQPTPQTQSSKPVELDIMRQFVSRDALERYNNIMATYKQATETVKKLQEDDSMKKYRSACQFAVTIPINAISVVSADHLRDKFQKLFALLSGAVVKANNNDVSINQHPLGKLFCELLVAKKLVNAAETIVTTNTARAEFAFSAVTVALWQKFPEIGHYFLAYLYKECPYFVPYFIPQIEGQSDMDYMKSLGYRYQNGSIEDQQQYLKRMGGTARLYAAVWITSPRRNETSPNPHGLDHGWRWLCNILNLDPQPDICATLIYETLKVAGHAMIQTYGKQFFKLLFFMQRQYFPKLNQIDQGGPKSRLEQFINEAVQCGKIDSPEGLLPPNFW